MSLFQRRVARAALRLAGWEVRGAAPEREGVLVMLAPHTSNWDFPLGLLALRALGLRPAFLVKEGLMRFPARLLFGPLGGVAVKRSAPGGMVARAVTLLRSGRSVGLLPKGTRSSGTWRSGFYHMALQAPAPVLLLTMDAGTRTVTVFGPHALTGNPAEDMRWFRTCMYGVQGVNPEREERVEIREESGAVAA